MITRRRDCLPVVGLLRAGSVQWAPPGRAWAGNKRWRRMLIMHRVGFSKRLPRRAKASWERCEHHKHAHTPIHFYAHVHTHRPWIRGGGVGSAPVSPPPPSVYFWGDFPLAKAFERNISAIAAITDRPARHFHSSSPVAPGLRYVYVKTGWKICRFSLTCHSEQWQCMGCSCERRTSAVRPTVTVFHF